tara:strand:+ start:217 stop:1056 length:840 start_codon:yes stop_codon:yes gene_type:complete
VNFISKLKKRWDSADSLLCVGLDPQIDRIPEVLRSKHSPYFEFCKEIVDATHEFVCAFKPQAAYFSAVGAEKELEELISYIKNVYPEIPVILDAKRGDIGSTAALYAQEAYQRYGADAVTVNPYLGFESIEPYMNYSDKGIVVLCRTSNAGSDWLQKSETDSIPVYQRVAQQVAEWNQAEQFILVTGATYPEELGRVRQIVGDMPLLVPGIGAQGGDIEAVLKNGLNKESTGLIISSSREILYAHEKVEQLVDISRGLTASRQVAIDTMNSINKYRNTL